MAKPKRDLRSMCLAARDGDHSAAKAVLRLYGFDALAREIKRNFPFSNRVRRQIDALTCAYGTEWEADLARIDLSSRRHRPRNIVFED